MKNFVKGLVISVLSLAVGYVAISLPFRLFDTLDSAMMQKVFIGELVIYLAIGLLFLALQQKKKEQQAKMQQRHSERRKKIARVQTEWYDLAA
ncbi:MAG: hypothetical protein IJR60_00595 [Eubacterium sp.]|nr:hypothetical protein [Eubacterium sp.]